MNLFKINSCHFFIFLMYELSKLREDCFHQKQPPEVLYKKCVLKNMAKFLEKHLYLSLVFNKVTGLRPATLLKNRLWHRCFHVNFAIFLRAPFLQNTSERRLLFHVIPYSTWKWFDFLTSFKLTLDYMVNFKILFQ